MWPCQLRPSLLLLLQGWYRHSRRTRTRKGEVIGIFNFQPSCTRFTTTKLVSLSSHGPIRNRHFTHYCIHCVEKSHLNFTFLCSVHNNTWNINSIPACETMGYKASFVVSYLPSSLHVLPCRAVPAYGYCFGWFHVNKQTVNIMLAIQNYLSLFELNNSMHSQNLHNG